jgi:hypothetical protein
MRQFSEMIVVTVTPYSGTTTADKNGLMPVMLQCMAGKMPNRNVLSGTVAERSGFHVGKTYLAQVREQGKDKVFGPAFTFVNMGELTPVDAVKACKDIGPPEILNVERPEGFEKVYERKGDAVESLITKRIQDGNFEPVIKRSYSHETAREVKEGSTIKDSSPSQDLDQSELKKNK